MIYSALPITQYPWPNNWADTFSRSGPLNVEIGFGNAQYLVSLAQQCEDEFFIGFERSVPSIRNGERKIAQTNLVNVCLIRATAFSGMWLLFRPTTISRIIINFPDPWPKASHQHRRVVNDNFLNLAASRMIQGGMMEIATDHSDYAAWIAERLLRSPYFECDLSAAYATEDQERIPTKYELKAINAGQECYYFKWSRNNILSTQSYAALQEYPMPHVVLQSPVDLDEIEESFGPRQYENGTTKIRFIALYHSVKANLLVVDTFVHEEPLEQRVLLSIAHRKSGDFQINLHETGFPRSTRGIHLAVHSLAEWVLGLREGGIITRHNLRLDDQ